MPVKKNNLIASSRAARVRRPIERQTSRSEPCLASLGKARQSEASKPPFLIGWRPWAGGRPRATVLPPPPSHLSWTARGPQGRHRERPDDEHGERHRSATLLCLLACCCRRRQARPGQAKPSQAPASPYLLGRCGSAQSQQRPEPCALADSRAAQPLFRSTLVAADVCVRRGGQSLAVPSRSALFSEIAPSCPGTGRGGAVNGQRGPSNRNRTTARASPPLPRFQPELPPTSIVQVHVPACHVPLALRPRSRKRKERDLDGRTRWLLLYYGDVARVLGPDTLPCHPACNLALHPTLSGPDPGWWAWRPPSSRHRHIRWTVRWTSGPIGPNQAAAVSLGSVSLTVVHAYLDGPASGYLVPTQQGRSVLVLEPTVVVLRSR
ncbi:uncharacterized protein PSFLO_06188 [Pseudozyma flocculosa]|uniref:Uncharacterized protein n=1 Tax=Pseudozyma flocculosa TaxID=84751 RepID=A0A5C3F9D9_9BASI|nr:uncharacterized protein PSFLO_06188 [Pseudozyma flocculosa]